MGAPTIRTPRTRALVCAALRKGYTLVAAAAAADCCYESIRAWRADDAAFSAALTAAKAKGRKRLERYVLDGTKGDPKHALEVLSRLHSKAWGRKDALTVGGKLTVDVAKIDRMTPEEKLEECLRAKADLEVEIATLRKAVKGGSS